MKSILFTALLLGLVSTNDAAAQTYSRTDTITYEDNLSRWVIGQQKSSTNLETGLIESRTVYDPVTSLPLETYAFEKPQQRMTYYADGTLATVSDGRDGISYDTTVALGQWKRGIPQTISFPDGTGKSAVVDDLGQILSVIDETGAKTCYAYDTMGRLARITYPSESQSGVCADYNPTTNPNGWNPTILSFAPVTTAEYGIGASHWKQTVTTGNGAKVSYLDSLWRPLVVESYDAGNAAATRSVSVTRYDSDGRTIYQGYPVASVTDYATSNQGTRTWYDALGRNTRLEQDSELGVLATTTAYLTGFKTQVTNPRGKVTTTSYKTYDQPSTDWPVAITHPEGTYTDIARDVFGKPTNLTRRDATGAGGWQRRYFAYNANQELCSRTEVETGTTAMGYDAAGNLAWSASGQAWAPDGPCAAATDAAVAARRSDRTYDQRNRISTLSFADGKGNTTYTYTPDGLQATATVDNGDGNVVTTTYGYDKRRLLTSEQMTWSAIAWTLGYDYNANGHLASQTYPGSLTVDYLPNALGQPTKAGTYASGVQYYPNGAIKQFTYGNGIVHTMTQNARQLPEVSRDAYGTTEVLDDGYDYDQNGNVVAISDGATVDAHGNRTMAYDGLDRLLSATSTGMFGGTIRYTYDALDNLQTVVKPGANLRYCYDSGWHLAFIRSGSTNCSDGAATTSLTYDVQGNLASKNGTGYQFDLGNRLRSTTGAVASSYVYDAAGRRVRDVMAGSKYSLYTQAGQLGFTSDARANEQQWYVYLGGSLVAIRERNTGTGAVSLKYQHTDALGTPVAVTDSSRNPVEKSDYDPYGKVLNRPVHDGPGYTGHVEDAATGLTYMQQRYYDPAIGRFLSVDPVTANGGTGANFNRYWYANNSPYKFTDPDGRQACSDSCMKMRATSDGGIARGIATQEFSKFLGSINDISSNYKFDSPAKAAHFFDQVARNGRNLGWEVGANVMQGSGGFYTADFHTDFQRNSVDAMTPSSSDRWFAMIHTHPGNALFSGAGDYWNRQTGFQGSIAYRYGSMSGRTDIATAQLNSVNAIVTLANGQAWLWDYQKFNAATKSDSAWTVYVDDYFSRIR